MTMHAQMFDANTFKRRVKQWMRLHPDGSEAELGDFCEELIPPAQYAANRWIVEHTLSWYRHILAQRKREDGRYNLDDEDDVD